ncbi:hypothetical protein GGR58DRAFT_500938 [Xylaria digitata]|nr:hypothetical protein GGR58DRAFT_500938 [Xylaria digitata]
MSRCHHTEGDLEALHALQAAALLCSAAWAAAVQSVVPLAQLVGLCATRVSLFELVRKGGKRSRQRLISFRHRTPQMWLQQETENGGCMRVDAVQGIVDKLGRCLWVTMQMRSLELDQVPSCHGPVGIILGAGRQALLCFNNPYP